MRYVIAAVLLALALISTAGAQADRDVIVQLHISRGSGQGGSIKGTYNGMAVEGTYTGTYVCNEAGCTLTGK